MKANKCIRNIFLVLSLSVSLLINCDPGGSGASMIEAGQFEIHVKSEENRLNEEQRGKITGELSRRISMVDPHEGSVLGILNESETGELVEAGDIANTLAEVLELSERCYGAFDPTVQILWDVYDFGSGGRWVSEKELKDALRWVDHRNVELQESKILRRNRHTRFGLGPVLAGAVVDWTAELLESENMTGNVKASHCLRCLDTGSGDNVEYEFRYPLDKLSEGDLRLNIGYFNVYPGECVAALDDDEMFFFRHGEQFHMVLNPVTGKPEREVRAAVVISERSTLEAVVFAYAVMVMGVERGLEFLDETEGVTGIILDKDHEVKVSGEMGERFWR